MGRCPSARGQPLEPRPSVDDSLSFVRVVHDGKLSEQVLESRLASAAGDPVVADRLADDAGRLYGLQLYEKVNYRLVDEDGATGAEFEAKTKSWGPNLLQFGISLEDDLEAMQTHRPDLAIGAWRRT